MKTVRKVVFAVVALIAAACLSAQEIPNDIKLTNGFVMRDCTILVWSKDAITVQFVGGTVPVRYVNISPEQRPIFEKHKAGMMRREASNQRRASIAAQRDGENDAASRQQESAKAEKDQKKADDIAHGVTWHHLVIGMNYDQVRQAIGGPTSTSATHGDTNFDHWTYAARGKGVDAYGNPKDLRLMFTDGILTTWNEW